MNNPIITKSVMTRNLKYALYRRIKNEYQTFILLIGMPKDMY